MLSPSQTNFYRVQQQLAKGKPTQTLFTTLDEDFHAAIKRPVSSAYSMSTLTEFEPFVDSTIRSMFIQLDGFVTQCKDCDIARWLQYCKTQYYVVLCHFSHEVQMHST